jgi:hypothetical protein
MFMLRMLVIGSILLVTAGSGFSSPFTNGSFELPGGAPIRLFLGNNDPFVTGWINNASVITGNQVYESSGQDGIAAGAGTYYVSWGLAQSTGGTLQQTFDTVAGTSYAISYLLTTQQSAGSVLQSNMVAVYNGSILTGPNLLNSVSNSFLPNDGVWFSGTTLSFTAIGSSTTLIFSDTTPSANTPTANWGLDAVAVSAVPEPTTAILLTIPLGAMLIVRRRREKA